MKNLPLMENVISATEQKLQLIMQNAPLALIEILGSGEIVSINLIADTILTSLIGKKLAEGMNFYPVLDVISPTLSEAILNYREQSGLIIMNQVFQCECYDDQIKHLQVTISKYASDCILVTIDEVTLRIKEEEALRKAEQDKAVAQGKYDIASEVLHDIGNAIVGFSSYMTRINRILSVNNHANLGNVVNFLVQRQPDIATSIGDAKANALVTMLEGINNTAIENHEAIQLAISEQLRIMKHIQEILNIQRQYVVGHENQERKAVNLKEIISDCRALILPLVEKKGISMYVDVPVSGITINGDKTKLVQVILNILKNSIEAIDNNCALKEITVILGETENTIDLKIIDTGRGIEADKLSRLFDRGFTTKTTGTGLGLYNCRAIVESHSGTISMTSDGNGKGTTTTIEFNR